MTCARRAAEPQINIAKPAERRGRRNGTSATLDAPLADVDRLPLEPSIRWPEEIQPAAGASSPRGVQDAGGAGRGHFVSSSLRPYFLQKADYFALPDAVLQAANTPESCDVTDLAS